MCYPKKQRKKTTTWQIDNAALHATSLICSDRPKQAWWQQKMEMEKNRDYLIQIRKCCGLLYVMCSKQDILTR